MNEVEFTQYVKDVANYVPRSSSWVYGTPWSQIAETIKQMKNGSPIKVVSETYHEEGNYGTVLQVVFEWFDEEQNIWRFFAASGHEKSFDYEEYWNDELVEVRYQTKTITEWIPV